MALTPPAPQERNEPTPANTETRTISYAPSSKRSRTQHIPNRVQDTVLEINDNRLSK